MCCRDTNIDQVKFGCGLLALICEHGIITVLFTFLILESIRARLLQDYPSETMEILLKRCSDPDREIFITTLMAATSLANDRIICFQVF